MRVTFEEITARREATLTCRSCRRRFKRVFKEMQTLNPFNQHPDGRPKSRAEIQQECDTKADAAVKRAKIAGIICSRCEGAK